MLAAGYWAVALTGSLDLASLVAAGIAIAGRALKLGRMVRFEVPDKVSNALALAYLGFLPIDYYWVSQDFLQAAMHLVFFLASVVVLRARSRRDFFFVKLSALMLMVAASVLASSFSYFLFLAVFALCGIMAQISGQLLEGQSPKAGLARTRGFALAVPLIKISGMILLGTLLLAGALFVALPRTAMAALQYWSPERIRLPGFANEVQLGQIGRIQVTQTPVMHVRIQSAEPMALKWRGSALTRFDGKRWFNAGVEEERLVAESRQVRLGRGDTRQGQRLEYEVQLRDATGDVLFLAGIPETLFTDASYLFRTPVDSYRFGRGQGRGARYEAWGYLEPPRPPYRPGLRMDQQARIEALGLPPLDPRIPELATRVTAGSGSPLAAARDVEHHLRTSYAYVLESLDREIPDPIGRFLFETKAGHCEYFASAMAVMLRSAGIPARVATGFQSGTLNPITGWYLIRASDAHSWVEAWIDGYGWMTFDPTPAAPAGAQSALLTQMALYWDAAEVFWQEWVMSYDLERQLTLAQKAGQSTSAWTASWRARWQALERAAQGLGSRWLWLVPAVFALAWGLYLLVKWAIRAIRSLPSQRQKPTVAGEAAELYVRLLRALERQGVEKPRWMTPDEFASSIAAPYPGMMVREFTVAYQAMRFGGRAEMAGALREILDRLEKPVVRNR